MIIQYVRKGKGKTKKGKRIKKGVMVAYPDTDANVIRFGFSLCCFRKAKKDVDEFDKDFCMNLAKDRALTYDRPLVIPFSMKKAFASFVDRCKRYYKQIPADSPNQQEIIYKEQEQSPVLL